MDTFLKSNETKREIAVVDMAVSRLTRSLLRQHQFPGYHQTTANIEAPYVKVHSPSCAENYTRCRKGPRLSPKGPLSTKRRRKAPCPKFSHVLPTFSRATTQSAPNNRKPPDLNKRELQSAKRQLKHQLLLFTHLTSMTQTPKTQFPILRLQYTIPKFSSHVPHDNFSPFPLNNPHDARRELGCPPELCTTKKGALEVDRTRYVLMPSLVSMHG
jgi:hypothetical protein